MSTETNDICFLIYFVHIYFRSTSNMQLDMREIGVTLGNCCDNTDFDKPNVI